MAVADRRAMVIVPPLRGRTDNLTKHARTNIAAGSASKVKGKIYLDIMGSSVYQAFLLNLQIRCMVLGLLYYNLVTQF